MTGITDAEFEAIVDDLAYRYSDLFDRHVVASEVAAARAALEKDARRSDFLATLIAKKTRDRLANRAAAQGRGLKPVPTILYVCVHNNGRSQFAAALTRQLAGQHVHVRAAGMRPRGGVNPAVVQVPAERGIVIDEEFPTGIPYNVEDAADVVVDMGCDLPQYPARWTVRWDIDDPAGQDVETVRRICQKIEDNVRTLLDDLGIPVATQPSAVGV